MKKFQQTLLFAAALGLITVFLVRYSPQYHASREPPKAVATDGFSDDIWWFQMELSYTLPELHAPEVNAAPHNYHGPGHRTFATFFSSRSGSMADPYFMAAQQIVYRVLWDPVSRSKKYPMTVFVAPFISQQQRNYFQAAGARVQELDLHPFRPIHDGTSGRLRDMFSKLEMWKHTEYSEIAYLDSDAFPIDNIDAIFDIAEKQKCKQELVPVEDSEAIQEYCDYTFAGYQEMGTVNGGVMILSPNMHMYDRLVRLSTDQSAFDNGFMEQALLGVAFHPDGPFPPSYIPHAYNGGVDVKMAGKPLYIAHHKLWTTGWDPEDAWYKHSFEDNWNQMLSFYKTPEFRQARIAAQQD